MIEIVGLEKAFGEKILFSATSLRLGARDRIGLVGPNGSGKTTLFRMIAGEEHPDRGEILIRKGVHIGYLSQEPMPVQGRILAEEVQGGVKDLFVLEDKMRLLEEEIAEEKDPGNLEALAKSYGHWRNGTPGGGDTPWSRRPRRFFRAWVFGSRIFSLVRGTQRGVADAAGSGQDFVANPGPAASG